MGWGSGKCDEDDRVGVEAARFLPFPKRENMKDSKVLPFLANTYSLVMGIESLSKVLLDAFRKNKIVYCETKIIQEEKTVS